ncbi:3485_t:CDS:2 [Funneliformis mosseae]|uniref:3485_t:CDS:1 n=1 Tax=Funneliformis mosseae TaxID=27381 RepID=A0A9N9F2D2_FUNMO|nr:3485_t:CDS:2 [Funneliformis mosseae]
METLLSDSKKEALEDLHAEKNREIAELRESLNLANQKNSRLENKLEVRTEQRDRAIKYI